MWHLERLLLGIGIALAAGMVMAQGFRGGGGGERGRSDRPLTPEEINQRLSRMEDFLRKADTNHNGTLEAEEVSNGPAKFMLQRVFSRMGKEVKFPIAISEIKQLMTTYYQTRGTPGGPPGGMAPGAMPPRAAGPGDAARSPFGPGGPGAQPPPAAVAGFGEAAPAVRAMVVGPGTLGPGVPPGSGPPQGTPPGQPQVVSQPSSPPAGSVIDPAIDQKIRSLAAAIIQKNDKGGDGKLDREEWPSQGKWGTFNEANRSGGTAVGLSDLIVHLTDLYRRQQLSLDSIDSAAPGVEKPAPRKSGRFLTPKERLPKGLPDWFAQKDVDGDGQINMAEYTTDWTPAAVAEFNRYDLNQDGIITAAECLKADKPRTPKSQ